MTERTPGEKLDTFIIRSLYEAGSLWAPGNPEGHNLTRNDLKLLSVGDPVVQRAMQDYSRLEAVRYAQATLEIHGRLPDFDGVLGPAMRTIMLDTSHRCPVPDHAPPPGVTFTFEDPDLEQVVRHMQEHSQPEMAVGTGNWKRCHGVGEFHCSIVKINKSGLPQHVAPHFTKILTRVQSAYAATGLLFRFTDEGGVDWLNGQDLSSRNVNIDFSFVGRSDGWIGLAIVGTNEGCGGRIWCRYLNTFLSNNASVERIISDWVTLIMHELGHNCGRSHTSGGVMNPSLISMLPGIWSPSDPSTGWLNSRHGGRPVPIPGDPNPSPGPPPPTGGEISMHDLMQNVLIEWLIKKSDKQEARIRALEARNN